MGVAVAVWDALTPVSNSQIQSFFDCAIVFICDSSTLPLASIPYPTSTKHPEGSCQIFF